MSASTSSTRCSRQDIQSGERGEETLTLEENQSTFIPIGMKHRPENPGAAPLFIVEVHSGVYLGEDDIERFEDRYNRR